jgi:hypothetical protein
MKKISTVLLFSGLLLGAFASEKQDQIRQLSMEAEEIKSTLRTINTLTNALIGISQRIMQLQEQERQESQVKPDSSAVKKGK